MHEDFNGKKIVIVEDNTALADIYKTRLEMKGFKCFVAYDGIAALYTIQTEKPDLVLLDLMVPSIAGDEVLKRMRANDWGKDIPVYIISNLNEADAPSGLRDLSIEGYAVKANMVNDDIDKIVEEVLGPDYKSNVEENPPKVEQPADATPEEPTDPTSETDAPADVKVVDATNNDPEEQMTEETPPSA